MSIKWPPVKLSEVLEEDIDRVKIDPTSIYEMVGVYSFGRGLFLREPVYGGKTSYKYFNRLHADHIVMRQLFGWEGALALSSEKFANKYVSPQFPTFRTKQDRLDRLFLGWYLRRSAVWEELKRRTRGMGDRRRTLNPAAFLECTIPLPPLSEQRRIAAKIDQLAGKIEEFNRVKIRIQKDINALLVAMAYRQDLSTTEKKKRAWREVSLGDVLTQVSEPVKVMPGKNYPHFGIFSFAKGLFKKPDLSGDTIKANKLYRVHSGNFIYARLNAYEGAFGIINNDFNEHFVSNEFPTFKCSPDAVLPEFLFAYFQSPKVWEDIKRIVTGIGGGAGNRRIRLKEKVFLSLKIFLPPIDWQRKIKAIMEKLNAIKYEQEMNRLKEDALLPSFLDKAFKGEL